MHIISSRQTEQICVGKDIVLTIVKVNGEKIRIGIEAPTAMKVLRSELNDNEPKILSLPKAQASTQVVVSKTAAAKSLDKQSDIFRFRKAA